MHHTVRYVLRRELPWQERTPTALRVIDTRKIQAHAVPERQPTYVFLFQVLPRQGLSNEDTYYSLIFERRTALIYRPTINTRTRDVDA